MISVRPLISIQRLAAESHHSQLIPFDFYSLMLAQVLASRRSPSRIHLAIVRMRSFLIMLLPIERLCSSISLTCPWIIVSLRATLSPWLPILFGLSLPVAI